MELRATKRRECWGEGGGVKTQVAWRIGMDFAPESIELTSKKVVCLVFIEKSGRGTPYYI